MAVVRFNLLRLALATALLFTASASAQERGVLFKVSAHGHSMHVFGTLHVSDPAYHPNDPVLLKAIENASLLYVEDVGGGASGFWSVMSLRRDPAYALLSKDAQARLTATLQRLQLPEALAYRMHPMALATAMVMKRCPPPSGAKLSVDAYLVEFARQKRVAVEAIEDRRQTMAVLDNMPPEVRADAIESGVEELESGAACQDWAAMLNGWLASDDAVFLALREKGAARTSSSGRYHYQHLLRERDARMAEKLIALLPRQDRVVAAVGTSHLVGEDSVIDLLRASGATVEQLY